MSWNTGTTYASGTGLTAAHINGIGNDLRAWGGNVDAAGNALANLATLNVLTIAPQASFPSIMILTLAGVGSAELRISNGATNDDSMYLEFFDHLGAGSAAGVYFTGYVGGDMPKLAFLATKLGIGTASPTVSGTGRLHVVGDTARLTPTARTPANSAAAGNDGEWCADSSYVYVHTGGSWRRAAVATF